VRCFVCLGVPVFPKFTFWHLLHLLHGSSENYIKAARWAASQTHIRQRQRGVWVSSARYFHSGVQPWKCQPSSVFILTPGVWALVCVFLSFVWLARHLWFKIWKDRIYQISEKCLIWENIFAVQLERFEVCRRRFRECWVSGTKAPIRGE